MPPLLLKRNSFVNEQRSDPSPWIIAVLSLLWRMFVITIVRSFAFFVATVVVFATSLLLFLCFPCLIGVVFSGWLSDSYKLVRRKVGRRVTLKSEGRKIG